MNIPKNAFISLFILTFLLLASSCGSSGSEPIIPTGPNMDITSLTSLRIDQLKFTADLTYDKDKAPDPVLYLRCADSDIDIACAGKEQGLSIVKKNGVGYGKIGTAFIPVEDITIDKCFNVKLVFVQKNSNDCPAAITDNDTELWVSSVLTLDDKGVGSLLKNKIANTDETLMAYLIAPIDTYADDLQLTTPEQTDMVVRIDRLYFKKPVMPRIGTKTVSFQLDLASTDGTINCAATFDSKAAGISNEGIIYGNLAIDLLDDSGNKCEIAADTETKQKEMTVTLYNSESKDVLRSEPTTFVDLVDNDLKNVKFGDDGYIRFVPIQNIQ